MKKLSFLILLVGISIAHGCITLYRDYGPSGDSFVMCSSGNVPPEWNDQVSAIVVPSGWRVVAYRDYDYGGDSVPIGSGTWSAPAEWNDQISSVRIRQGCPVFFQDFELRGASLVVCRSGDVPAAWNDQISSGYLPRGWRMTLYRDYGFGGPSIRAIAGGWTAPPGWNDQVSSIRVTRRG
jgi:hypothetical protein